MNALAEFLAVNGDAVAVSVGHAGIAVAGQAVSLRTKSAGRERQCQNSGGREHRPADIASHSYPCGVVHPAVFLPQAKEEFPQLSWSRISPSPLRLPDGSGCEDRFTEMTLFGRVLAVTGITTPTMQITKQLSAISYQRAAGTRQT
jgi:hypothetical protein